MTLPSQQGTLPKHLAMVLDGHRRFSQRTGCSLEEAYELGTLSIKGLVRHCLEKGIAHLTLHTFSPNDLERAPKDVFAFLNVIRRSLEENLESYERELGVRIQIIGQTENLDNTLRRLVYPFHQELCNVLSDAAWKTRLNDKLVLTLGLNYSGRADIVRAMNALYLRGRFGACGLEMSDLDIILPGFSTNNLDLPPMDLFIFTGMEQGRALPDIFFWQLVTSMAKLYTTPTLWPDFGREELGRILTDYSGVVTI